MLNKMENGSGLLLVGTFDGSLVGVENDGEWVGLLLVGTFDGSLVGVEYDGEWVGLLLVGI